ncbi:MAG: chlorite dismutase family protein [Anaerolineales bacterium]|nr:chlorite dismutase family protein [Anaerolineales bacterium]
MTQESFQLDLSEKGKDKNGQTISLDRRLFMQLLAYGGCRNTGALIEALDQTNFDSVLYADLNDPQGIALLVMHEDPDYFVTELRQLLNQPLFAGLTPKPEYTMLGRTYSVGYEQDLEATLLTRPRRRVLDPEWLWAVWYPLRRVKTFETLPEQEQKLVLMEHGGIGMSFGKAGLAHDIRLSCHGLDKNDNDFVIAVLGRELYPCSAVVQAMRKTKQTSQYLESLGPFFIGKAIWQAKID